MRLDKNGSRVDAELVTEIKVLVAPDVLLLHIIMLMLICLIQTKYLTTLILGDTNSRYYNFGIMLIHQVKLELYILIKAFMDLIIFMILVVCQQLH